MNANQELWVCKAKPETSVTRLGNAEFRAGEIREKATVYERNGKLYVRRTSEFEAKFRRA
jgi:hypothetical protein